MNRGLHEKSYLICKILFKEDLCAFSFFNYEEMPVSYSLTFVNSLSDVVVKYSVSVNFLGII